MTRIDATPWARDALTPDEMAGLDARAAELGAHIHIGRTKDGRWNVHATGVGVRVSRVLQVGRLYPIVDDVLDEYAVEQRLTDEELGRLLGLSIALDFTNEELGVVREQSDAR